MSSACRPTPASGNSRRGLRVVVHRREDALAVRGDAPVHAAIGAAVAEPAASRPACRHCPDRAPRSRRTSGRRAGCPVRPARLAITTEPPKSWSTRDALVRAEAVGAARAGIVPEVARRRLEHPFALAGIEVERDDGVGGVDEGDRVLLARADIEEVALLIDRRRVPDRRAGGSPHLRADAAELRLRRLVHRAAGPDLLAGLEVERDDRALRLAALIGLVDRVVDLGRRQRRVDRRPCRSPARR